MAGRYYVRCNSCLKRLLHGKDKEKLDELCAVSGIHHHWVGVEEQDPYVNERAVKFSDPVCPVCRIQTTNEECCGRLINCDTMNLLGNGYGAPVHAGYVRLMATEPWENRMGSCERCSTQQVVGTRCCSRYVDDQ